MDPVKQITFFQIFFVGKSEKMTENWIKSDLAGGAGASNLVFNEKIKKLRVSLCVEALLCYSDGHNFSVSKFMFLGGGRSNSPFGLRTVSLSTTEIGRRGRQNLEHKLGSEFYDENYVT